VIILHNYLSYDTASSFVRFLSSNLYYILIAIFVLVYLIRYINKQIKKNTLTDKLFEINMTDDFRRKYIELYNENISILESERKKILFIYIICIIILIISAILAIVFQYHILLYISAISVVAIFLLKIIKKFNNYSNIFKNNVIAKFVPMINDKLTYTPSSGISANIYEASKLEDEMFNIYKYDDSISGDISEDIKIDLCELQVKRETGSGKNKNITELFCGLFGYFRCSKNFNTVLKIKRNSISFLKYDSIVNMDSSEFEKYFDVYSENKVITMQILTPEVMEILLDFYSKYGVEFEISIVNNNVYFRFFTGKMFDAQIFGNSMDRKLLWKYYTVINFVLDLSQKINGILNNLEI
jgi:hypothetical protein